MANINDEASAESVGLVYSDDAPVKVSRHLVSVQQGAADVNNLLDIATTDMRHFVTAQLQAEKHAKFEWPFEPTESARAAPTLSRASSRKVYRKPADSGVQEQALDAIFFDTACLRSAYTFPRTRDAMRPETVEALRGASRASALRLLAADDTHHHSSKQPISSIANERTESGVVPALFPTQLRSGRGLGVPAERIQWPRPIKTYSGTIPTNKGTQAKEELRRMEILKHRHEDHLQEAARLHKKAQMTARTLKDIQLERSFQHHSEQVNQGKKLLEELNAQFLEPFLSRRRKQVESAHASWQQQVYEPSRKALEDTITDKFGVVSMQAVMSNIFMAQANPTEAVHNQSAVRLTKTELDARDPTKKPLRRWINEQNEVGRTKYEAALKDCGANMQLDGSYIMRVPLSETSMHPTSHDVRERLDVLSHDAEAAVSRRSRRRQLSRSGSRSRSRLLVSSSSRSIASIAAASAKPKNAAPSSVAIGIATYRTTQALPPRQAVLSGGDSEGTVPQAVQLTSATALLRPTGESRPLLNAAAWGSGVIENTTFAHSWPVVGDGLLASNNALVRDFAVAGEEKLAVYQERLYGKFDEPLTPKALSATLLHEAAGYGPGYRGKKRVDVVVHRAEDMDSTARGRKRNPELDAKLSRDVVASLMNVKETSDPPELPKPGLRLVQLSPSARVDHVREALESLADFHNSVPARRGYVVGQRAHSGFYPDVKADPTILAVAGRPSRAAHAPVETAAASFQQLGTEKRSMPIVGIEKSSL